MLRSEGLESPTVAQKQFTLDKLFVFSLVRTACNFIFRIFFFSVLKSEFPVFYSAGRGPLLMQRLV